jgi:hypothetical protein
VDPGVEVPSESSTAHSLPLSLSAVAKHAATSKRLIYRRWLRLCVCVCVCVCVYISVCVCVCVCVCVSIHVYI